MGNPQDRSTPAKLVYAIDPPGRYVPVPRAFLWLELQDIAVRATE